MFDGTFISIIWEAEAGIAFEATNVTADPDDLNNVIVFKLEHSAKAYWFMVCKDCGKIIDCNAVQRIKQLEFNEEHVLSVGKITLVNAEQFWNAVWPIDIRALLIFTVSNEIQSAKAFVPKVLSDTGSDTSVRLLHPLKTPFVILVKFVALEKSIDDKFLQLVKA